MTDEELYTVDATHTDPTEIKTALALAERQLKRAEKLNKGLIEALECIKASSYPGLAVKESKLLNRIYKHTTEVLNSNTDKQLEDVLMPDKGGE